MQPYKRTLRRRHQNSFETLWDYAAFDEPSIKAAGLADVAFPTVLELLAAPLVVLEDVVEGRLCNDPTVANGHTLG